MEEFLPIAYFEGNFVPFKDAKISIATHALHYGTGAFGGLRGWVNESQPDRAILFRLDRHCQRLSNSARYMHYDLPPAKIQEALLEFVRKNHPSKPFYLRPFVYSSGLGIAPRLHDIEQNFFIYGLYLGEYLSKPGGISCRISSWHRQEDIALPLRGKISGAYITSSLAKTEAVKSGFDEAILINSQGKVAEATGMNIFMVRNGKLYTPGSDQDILEGITRDSILTIAKNAGIEVVERPIDKSELFIADEVFLCGTAAKVSPVSRVENYQVPQAPGTISQHIAKELTAISEGRHESYADWITAVPFA
jgi:branched-chain amino acid aminotransferase